MKEQFLAALVILVVALVFIYPQTRRIEKYTAGVASVTDRVAENCKSMVTPIRKWLIDFECILRPERGGINAEQQAAFLKFTNSCVKIDCGTGKYRPIVFADIGDYSLRLNQLFGDIIGSEQGCGLLIEQSCRVAQIDYYEWDAQLEVVIAQLLQLIGLVQHTLGQKYLLDMLVHTFYVLRTNRQERLDLHEAFLKTVASPNPPSSNSSI
jgi:hypothetical protein